MKPRPLFWPAAAIALVVTLVLVGWEFRSERKARARLVEVSERRAGVEADIRTTKIRISAVERKQPVLGTKPVALKPKKASTKPRGGDFAVLLVKNPKLNDLYLKSYLAKLNLTYLPLFRQLGLSQDQIDKLETLMTNAEASKMELKAAARSHGFADADPQSAALLEQQNAQLLTAEADLLSPSAYQQLQQFSALEPVAPFVSNLSGGAALQGTPLTDAQKMQLMQAAAQSTGSVGTNGAFDPETIDWAQLITQSESFLTPAQLALLKSKEADFEAGSSAMALMKEFYANPAATK